MPATGFVVANQLSPFWTSAITFVDSASVNCRATSGLARSRAVTTVPSRYSSSGRPPARTPPRPRAWEPPSCSPACPSPRRCGAKLRLTARNSSDSRSWSAASPAARSRRARWSLQLGRAYDARGRLSIGHGENAPALAPVNHLRAGHGLRVCAPARPRRCRSWQPLRRRPDRRPWRTSIGGGGVGCRRSRRPAGVRHLSFRWRDGPSTDPRLSRWRRRHPRLDGLADLKCWSSCSRARRSRTPSPRGCRSSSGCLPDWRSWPPTRMGSALERLPEIGCIPGRRPRHSGETSTRWGALSPPAGTSAAGRRSGSARACRGTPRLRAAG